jgi:hypothetical protein
VFIFDIVLDQAGVVANTVKIGLYVLLHTLPGISEHIIIVPGIVQAVEYTLVSTRVGFPATITPNEELMPGFGSVKLPLLLVDRFVIA